MNREFLEKYKFRVLRLLAKEKVPYNSLTIKEYNNEWFYECEVYC